LWYFNDFGWLEDITAAYEDPATGQMREGWPPLEVHPALPLLAACHLCGVAPDGASVYSRCITLSHWFYDLDRDEAVSEASARLIAEKTGELGLAEAKLYIDYLEWGPYAGGIYHLGK
jgi:hypothetical protein